MWGDLPGTAVAVCCTAAVADEPRRHGGADELQELEEVPHGHHRGFDLHRRQLTYDYLDVVTGQVDRGRVVPADRSQLRSFLARFQGQGEVAFAVEAAPAGATWWRSWSGPASGPSWPSRRRRLVVDPAGAGA